MDEPSVDQREKGDVAAVPPFLELPCLDAHSLERGGERIEVLLGSHPNLHRYPRLNTRKGHRQIGDEKEDAINAQDGAERAPQRAAEEGT
jgi:hypothetical protein